MKRTFLSARCQNRSGIRFVLHAADRSSDAAALQSEVEAADSGEEGDGP